MNKSNTFSQSSHHLSEYIYHWLVFLVFMVIHGYTCFCTAMFGDDYYYAGFVKNGFDYFVSENMLHYRETNGRSLVHILDELFLGYDFLFWRIFNMILMAFFVIVVAKLAAQSWRIDRKASVTEFRLSLTAVCAVLGITELAILRESVYWATGAMNYLFPVTLTLWYYYFFRRDYERMKGSWYLLFPAVFASMTTEQAAAVALMIPICFIVSGILLRKQSPRPAWVVSLILSAVGFSALFFAPGTTARKDLYSDFYRKSLSQRIETNVSELTELLIGRNGMYLIICFILISVVYVCLKTVGNTDKALPIRSISLFIGAEAAVTFGIYMWGLCGKSTLLILKDRTAANTATADSVRILNQSAAANPWVAYLIAIPVVVVMIYAIVLYFRDKDIDTLFFVWGAVMSQAVMLLTPVYGSRTMFIGLSLVIIPLIRLWVTERSTALTLLLTLTAAALLPSYIKNPGIFAICFGYAAFAGCMLMISNPSKGKLSLCLAVSFSIGQFSTVAAGYAGNAAVHEKNTAQLESCAADKDAKSLILYYLPNTVYAYTMPYDNIYHKEKLLDLYGIDEKITVWYEFLPEYIY